MHPYLACFNALACGVSICDAMWKQHVGRPVTWDVVFAVANTFCMLVNLGIIRFAGGAA